MEPGSEVFVIRDELSNISCLSQEPIVVVKLLRLESRLRVKPRDGAKELTFFDHLLDLNWLLLGLDEDTDRVANASRESKRRALLDVVEVNDLARVDAVPSLLELFGFEDSCIISVKNGNDLDDHSEVHSVLLFLATHDVNVDLSANRSALSDLSRVEPKELLVRLYGLRVQ